MAYRNIVDIVHVSFIHIILPHFLTDSLVNIIIFEVCHLSAHLGTLVGCVRDDCWHIWVSKG